MISFASIRLLTAGSLLLLPALCDAGCKIETASAPLHATVSAGQGCLRKVEVKVCVPQGKKPKSPAVRGVSASPNIDVSTAVKDAGGGCVVGTATVQARNVMGPSFLEYCPEGTYDGRVEVTYCR